MIPIFLHPKKSRLAVIGQGPLAVRRLEWLVAGGAAPDLWWTGEDQPPQSPGALHPWLPRDDELRRYHAIWVAGLERNQNESLFEAARVSGTLCNVEDAAPLCDFHTPAIVRRGKLIAAVGTGGSSPAAARLARQRLEEAFPMQWSTVLDEIADSRVALRAAAATSGEILDDARARLADAGLP
jgi:precorrin-2 dehydrogenase/sirohydrochlorin ferrochelatase